MLDNSSLQGSPGVPGETGLPGRPGKQVSVCKFIPL